MLNCAKKGKQIPAVPMPVITLAEHILSVLEVKVQSHCLFNIFRFIQKYRTKIFLFQKRYKSIYLVSNSSRWNVGNQNKTSYVLLLLFDIYRTSYTFLLLFVLYLGYTFCRDLLFSVNHTSKPVNQPYKYIYLVSKSSRGTLVMKTIHGVLLLIFTEMYTFLLLFVLNSYRQNTKNQHKFSTHQDMIPKSERKAVH